MTKPLTIALSKGRILKEVEPVLGDAFTIARTVEQMIDQFADAVLRFDAGRPCFDFLRRRRQTVQVEVHTANERDRIRSW